MAQTDALRRYLEAGLEFTHMTRERAESVIKDLVRAGEVQREQAQEWVEELLDRSRKNTDQLVQLVRREISSQLASMGIATRRDLDDLEGRLAAKTSRPATQTAAPVSKEPARAVASRRAPAKKVAKSTKAKSTSKSTKAKSTTKSSGKSTTKAAATRAPAKRATASNKAAKKAGRRL